MPTLLQFPTTDNLLLPGLLFEPKTSTKKCLIDIHGTGGSSILRYQKKTKAFTKVLNEQNIAYFIFNNRGAGYFSKIDGLKGSKIYGNAYELIKDCVHDIDGAITFLKDQGYTEISLIGFSTGANKICLYNYYKPINEIRSYILAAGGDDTGLYFNGWGEEKFLRLLEESRRKTENGHGQELIAELAQVGHIMSYQSLFDTINPDGDYNVFPFYEVLNTKKLSTKKLFREYASITRPTLVIYGDQDEHSYNQIPKIIDTLKDNTSTPDKFTFKLIEGADHGFHEREEELATTISVFLSSTL